MPRYVAFLRGINVGGHRIKMPRLRELFEELGFEQVWTFIASGNVVFSTSSHNVGALRLAIEAHLADRLGYEVPTFIRSPAQLSTIAEYQRARSSGAGQAESSLYVVFLPAPPSDALRSSFMCLESEMDAFEFSVREVYWLIQGKLTESPLFGMGLGKATGDVPTTMRNMTTLRRLDAKLAGQGKE